MKPGNMKSADVFHSQNFVALLLAGLMLAFINGSMAGAQSPRKILDAIRIEPRIGDSLPMAAAFRDHSGKTVQLSEIIHERPVVLCLVYFQCPMLCKLAADGLVRSVAGLPETVGKEFDIVFVSFDPRDTPKSANAARSHALKQYARKGTDAGWHFLTGTQASIDQLTAAVGFRYVWDEGSQQYAHAAGLMIISPDGIVTEYLDGVRFSPRELVLAVDRAAHNELSQREPTSFVRCYLYDPTTGRFGAAVQWTIRTLGMLTVVLLGATVYRLHRRGSVPHREETLQ
jgi:protein SCO1/2